jgi:hypothetical protein
METEDIPPTTLKPVPVTLAWEIITAAAPVLLRVNVCILLEPATTSAKFIVVAFVARVPDGLELEPDFDGADPALVKPTQPESDRTARDAKTRANKPSGARRLEVVLERL